MNLYFLSYIIILCGMITGLFYRENSIPYPVRESRRLRFTQRVQPVESMKK